MWIQNNQSFSLMIVIIFIFEALIPLCFDLLPFLFMQFLLLLIPKCLVIHRLLWFLDPSLRYHAVIVAPFFVVLIKPGNEVSVPVI